MGRNAKPTTKELAAAHYSLEGYNDSVACRKAGYKESVVRALASKIMRREQVIAAKLEIANSIKSGQLGGLAKVLLQEKLLNPPKDDKTRLGYIRTGMEYDQMLGGSAEAHLHLHATLPKVVQDMLLAKMEEIKAQKEGAIDVAIVSEGAGSEGQSEENHDGVQVGELTHGFQDRAIG